MAQTINISPNVLSILAQQVAHFLPSVGIRLAKADNPELGESFPLWMLPASAVITDNPLLNAMQTGKLHHQIFRNGKPVAFAYSQAFGPGDDDWQITAAFESSIPADIDASIDIADKDVSQNGDTRLLVLPAYQIQALWIVDDDGQNFIIPAVLPSDYRSSLQQRVYSATDFFSALEKVQHVVGVLF